MIYEKCKCSMSTYPYQYEDLDEETNEAIKRDFKAYTRGLMRIKPLNFIISPEYKNYGEKIYNMEVRPDDVWIVTFPKTGTTWTQAAMWSIINDGKLELLKENPTLNTSRFIEFEALQKDGMDCLLASNIIPEEFASMVKNVPDPFDTVLNDPRDKPRLIKTHLSFPLLPPKLLDTAKVVYVVRNPRDTCVSYYYHHKLIRIYGFEGDFKTFFDYFIRDLVAESPYWPHVIDAWNRRHHPNMLFLFYEDMKKDFSAALIKLAKFLEKPLSEDMLKYLVKELSIEEMKKNPGLNVEIPKEFGIFERDGNFVRKGIVGDWKNYFTAEMEQRMDEWSEKQREGCDIKFPGED